MEVYPEVYNGGMAKRVKRKSKSDIGDFLPAAPDIVKVIAMQGSTDSEIALMMGLDPKIVKAWRKMYPDFDKAIEEGRTAADLQVLEALHKKAVGYEYKKEVVVRTKDDVFVQEVNHVVEPETNAIKFWLSNRDPKRWSEKRHMQITGKDNEPAVAFGVKHESKVELISSILGLIQPKPDGA
jgi:hypothetical protein